VVKRATPSRDELLAILDEVKDPEVPVLSVVELGIVRDVSMSEGRVAVTITPTYSGCPAMREIEQLIGAALTQHGLGPVEIRTIYAPAWTTDWIGPAAREKLRAYGIAPPGSAATGVEELTPLRRRNATVACPYCGAADTEQRSEFGSTACKSIWYCRSCNQPFEEFKAI
jgi:ring-1,2-phenylacetyl-CoA epoxidase subunit PaaD